jgi:uncharacterized protein (DUF736 family)
MVQASRDEGHQIMANIGFFTGSDDALVGTITTMTINLKNVRITRDQARADEKAPSHRVFVGNAEIGAAWPKVAQQTGQCYLSVKLDDPSLPAPLWASLFEGENGERTLVWTRPR